MSVEKLVLEDGTEIKMVDGKVVIDTAYPLRLDRGQAYLLMLWLQEHLNENKEDSQKYMLHDKGYVCERIESKNKELYCAKCDGYHNFKLNCKEAGTGP